MIEARRVTSGDRAASALRDVSLTISSGECVAISGSRAPVTHLLRVLAGLHQPQSGSIHLRGASRPATATELRHAVTYVATDVIAAAGLSVDEYLRFSAGARGRHISRAETKANAERVGLDSAASAESLGISELAALGIAAALTTASGAVLIDRVMDALKPTIRPNVFRWLADARQRGLATAIVTDDVDVQGALCQRVIRIEDTRSAHAGRVPTGAR